MVLEETNRIKHIKQTCKENNSVLTCPFSKCECLSLLLQESPCSPNTVINTSASVPDAGNVPVWTLIE